VIDRRKIVIAGAATLAVAPLSCALAQTAGKVPVVGYLSAASRNEAFTRALRQGLTDLGYVEGRTIVIEERYAGGDPGRFPELIEDLLSRNVDVFITGGAVVTQSVLKRTTRVPIVVIAISNPSQLTSAVASLARPGGNVTGFASVSMDLHVKQLELLREVVPGLSILAVLARPPGATGTPERDFLERAGRALGITVRHVVLTTADRVGPLLQGARDDGARALLVVRDFGVESMRDDIVRAARAARLPAAYEQRSFAEAGGLLSYGTSFTDLYRRAATHVDKILKGSKPGDIPIEQPIKFELVINLKTAKALGITLPQALLLRADEVIE
jgi:putative tryptophan/tyrosine transport system substrate-binding protein